MKKIIDVSEIEALPVYDRFGLNLIAVQDLRALLDKAPSMSSEAVAKVIHTIGTGLLEGKTITKVMLDINYIDLPEGTPLFTQPQPDRAAELEAKLSAYENTVRTDNSAVIANLQATIKCMSETAQEASNRAIADHNQIQALQATNKKLLDALEEISRIANAPSFHYRNKALEAIAEAEMK